MHLLLLNEYTEVLNFKLFVLTLHVSINKFINILCTYGSVSVGLEEKQPSPQKTLPNV